jgi:hypothetical protein
MILIWRQKINKSLPPLAVEHLSGSRPVILLSDITDDDEEYDNNNNNNNSHIGSCAHTTESTNMQVQNIYHGK